MASNHRFHADKFLLRSGFGAACLAIGGLILLLNPDFGSVLVANIIGWILVLLGGLGLLVNGLGRPMLGLPATSLHVLGIALGIYLLCCPLMLASLIGIGMGIYLLIQGLGSILDALSLKKQGVSGKSSLILAIAMAVLGLVLIFSPLSTSRFIMTVCGLAMLILGGVSLLVRWRSARYLRDGSDIVDADE